MMGDEDKGSDLLESLPESVRDELRHFLGEYPPGDWKRSSGISMLRSALRLYHESLDDQQNDYERRLARMYSEVLLTLAQLVFYQAVPNIRIAIEGHVANELERWGWEDGQELMMLIEEDEAEPAS